MLKLFVYIIIFISVLFTACHSLDSNTTETIVLSDSSINDTLITQDKVENESVMMDSLLEINPQNLINYAKSLTGTPYLYGGTDPQKGLDCSGFITNVFNHFNKKIPRSSVDFTNYGTEVSFNDVKPGDLILFTGTDSTIRVVGHMGIVIQTQDTIKFIQSTSGKAYSVTTTPLNSYYQGRFVKFTRIINQNN